MDTITTTTVMPTVAAPRPRLESLSTGIAQPLTWHGDLARTALPSVGVPAGNAGNAAFVDSRTTAKQPHPPRGVPR